jgi:Na+-transporting NADH:ubiquinone oxidoreductase subunit F
MILSVIETTTIVASIGVFLIFSLFLVGLILFAKARLMPSGLVKILINGKETVEVHCRSQHTVYIGQ